MRARFHRAKQWSLMLGCLFVSAPALSTTFIVADTKDLTSVSDMVVLGRIESIRGVEEQRTLRTDVRVLVEEVVKGPAVSEVTVREPGGVVGERRRWVHGAPTFFVGERVLLFLRRNVRQELETTFLAMGKFSVVRSSRGREFAVRNLGQAQVFAVHHRQLRPASPVTTHGLSEFLTTLRGWAGPHTHEARVTAASRVAEESRWQEHFTFAGPSLVRWFLPDEGEPITYLTSEGGDADLGAAVSVEATDAAVAAWGTPGCSHLTLVNSGTAAPTPFSECDGSTEISFNDPFSEIADPVGCGGVLAVGGVCADSRAPESFKGALFYSITEGDVVVSNGFGGCPFWDATNLAELLTHEVGHTLGLAHSSEDPNEPDQSLREATMYYAAHFDGRGGALMADDVAGICALYPAGRTGAVSLRRFAIVFDSAALRPRDRLIVDGVLKLSTGSFAASADTLIIDLHAAGTRVFRLAVPPGAWKTDGAQTRFRYVGATGSGTSTVLLTLATPGSLRFSVRARALDLSPAHADPVVMSLALGSANVTETVLVLRSSARTRVYP